ncbi:1-phosphatidylinositol 4,5-bisphosphate phosphodiesterase eta-1 isoform X2 [Ambystoma mexicanum]|uniref:1-phosphatidylinositol 4,5-bisphosphate phosphodiesterase eta-1 isoform X2 n=1 Tax=Ambystoma mexicanum TaxID=8296 RepID=UPI0037E99548
MSYWSLDKRCYVQYCRHFLSDNGAFHVERCMSVMQSGTQMIKLKSGTKGLVRLFYLDEHRTCIRWRPSRKSDKAKIIIDSIYKVTEGRQSEIFHRHAEGNFDPSCCFTIYHGNHMECLDLITSNPEEARTWITGLKYLMAGISDEDSLAKRQRTHDQWVKQTFEEADKNRDGLLNIEEIYQLMHKLNVNLPRRKVRQMFQEADTDENQGTLTFEEFSVFYKMMSLRRDLYLLLLSYSGKKDHLTVDELGQFLKVEQKMNNVTTEYCLDVIRKFEVSEENKEQNVLGIEGFTSFMRSPVGDIFNPLHCEIYQDMDQPLCNYYIASSHNTYLTGDQLLSQSKVDMYAWVLQDGCRCIEVDCWDGADGEPVVHHGYTLTSKIPFKDVVEAINKHAFVKNEYPLILSIENHCSIQQQHKIAMYMKDIFSDKLDLSSVHVGDIKQLPSPQSLKGKILVKGKKLPYHLGDDASEGEVSDEDSADEIEDDCKLTYCFSNGTTEHQVESFIRKKLESLIKESQIRDKEEPDSFTVRALLKATHEGLHVNLKENSDPKERGKKSRSLMGNFAKHKKTSKARSKSLTAVDDDDGQDSTEKETGQLHRWSQTTYGILLTCAWIGGEDDLENHHYRIGRRRKTMKLCRALSDLVVYTNSVSAQDIMDDGSTGNVLSFSESRAHQVVQHKSEQFMMYNQKQLTRIYPSAYRIDSSNFNPVPYWNAGVQLVALNYQTEGRMMQLNRAKFKMNGNCGYVLKPQQMCKGTFNPFSGDPLPASPKKQLILKVISGQQLPKPPDSMLGDRGEIIDPFVEVEIIGLPADCCKEQTRVVDDNGFNPVWEETLTFTIHMPEIALVRFLVWDHDPIGRDFVGQRTVTFSSLMPGYRHVYLEGLTEASIFVHITINEIYGKWSPLILNPSYTILHFLGATKNRQFIGLKGLFNKSTKHSSLESSGHCVRKRSIGDRLLRRSASAPAKGRKKTKMGFQETSDFKDLVSETTGTREKDVVIRRTARSLQARPASMPVDKILAGLTTPTLEIVKDAKGKDNTPESSELKSSKMPTNEEPIFITHEEKSKCWLSTSLSQKPTNRDDMNVVTTKELFVHENMDILDLACRIPIEAHNQVCLKSRLSIEAEDLESVEENQNLEMKRCEEKDNMAEDNTVQRESMATNLFCHEAKDCVMTLSLSTIDAHSTINADNLVLHSTEPIHDSEISNLINEISSSNESDMGHSVSALIKLFDTTDDKTDLTFVSSLHGNSCQTLMSGHSQKFALGLNTPKNPSFSGVYPVQSSIYSAANTTVFSCPETTEHSVYTITHEDFLSPTLDYERENEMGVHKLDCALQISPSPQILQTKKGKKWLSSWDTLDNCSPSAETDRLGPYINSVGSSLVDLDGESQDLLTMTEYKIEEVSQIASPLKTGHSVGSPYCYNNGMQNIVSNEDDQNYLLDNLENFRTPVKHRSPQQFFQYVDFLDDHDLQTVQNPNDSLHVFRKSRLCNRNTPKPKKSLPFHSSAVGKQPSPCKSKSLGDLTSEDISCNFESKYKRISRSFLSSGIGSEMTDSCTMSLTQSSDPLTEQLRKLVSFDQEDGCPSFYSQQIDNDIPKPLVRKLSTRSQSRVRNIASRARERQEANKQKLLNSGVSGVVLRNKPAASPHPANRHSTGSYIAGYLNDFNGESLEGRGVPEGSCTSLHYRYKDQFCTDYSALQTNSCTADKPEIYFLLRL